MPQSRCPMLDRIRWSLSLAAIVAGASGCDGAGYRVVDLDGGSDGGGGAGGSEACAPSERPLPTGECQAPGIPADRCAPGFVADDRGGCAAVLPAEPCGPGTMALPGETQCREVAPCGDGPWGDIPVEGSTQFVDADYTLGDSDGSAAKPWQHIQDGIDAAEPGAIVAVAAGSYGDLVRITAHPVRLWGRCPSLVHITNMVAVLNEVAEGDIDGCEIRDLSLSHSEVGVAISGARDVEIDRVWIHDVEQMGVLVGEDWGSASMRLRGSLIEQAGSGIATTQSGIEVTDTVIRDIGGTSDTIGRGILAEQLDADPEPAILRSVLVERAAQAGIVLTGTDGTIEASLVRDSTPPPAAVDLGLGIVVSHGFDAQGRPATVEVRQTVVLRASTGGILAIGSEVLVEHTTVRDTLPSAEGSHSGFGLAAVWDEPTAARGTVTARECLVETSRGGGIIAASAAMQLESLLVRDTRPRVSDGALGVGITIAEDLNVAPGSAPAAAGTVRWSLVEDSHVSGISLSGAVVAVEATTVRSSLGMADGRFGDGVIVLGGMLPTELTLLASSIEHSARAGVVSFGSPVQLGANRFECNLIDLDGETFGAPAVFQDDGDNQCGCEDEPWPCQVLSAGLQAPTTPPP